jgi:xylulokinase
MKGDLLPVNFVMGVDIGSGACKVTILQIEGKGNGKDFNKPFSRTYSHEYNTIYPQPGWAQQDSGVWLECLSKLIKRAIVENDLDSSRIAAVALSGVTHSPVLLDRDLNVIGDVIHITDSRSIAQTEWLRKFNELFLRFNFNPVSPMWTVSMLKWIQENEPDRYSRIFKIIFPKDYVRMMLTGNIATDYIEAQGTLFFDTLNKKWSHELADIIGLDINILPDILSPFDITGKVTKDGSKWSFLKEGTPVVTGTTDTLLEILAAGNIKKGDCTVKLATFGRICILSEKPAPHEGIINYSYIIPGLWYPGTGTKSCASSYRWLRDEFFKDYLAMEKSGEALNPYSRFNGKEENLKTAFGEMDQGASRIEPGSNGLLFHPYLLGEGSPYNDAKLRGDFLGLTLHHKRAHMARAVLEGTAFSLKDSIEFLSEKGINPLGYLKFIGGGSKSSLWTTILADVLGHNGLIPLNTDASYGAAMLSAVAIKAYPSIEDAVKENTRFREKIICRAGAKKIYAGVYSLYKKAKEALTEINHELSEISQS